MNDPEPNPKQPPQILVHSIDEYGNIVPEMMNAREFAALKAADYFHPPFSHPEARKIMRELHESFREVDPDGFGTLESTEDGFRRNCNHTEIALFLKVRQAFSVMSRGRWNDLPYRKRLYQVLLKLSNGIDPSEACQSDEELRWVEKVAACWFIPPLFEEIHEQILPYFPPEVQPTRQDLEKHGFDYSLPENPDIDRFLKSVEAEFKLPSLPKEDLRRKARELWRNEHPDDKNPPITVLDRLCVDHLRHKHTNYDKELDRFLGKLDVATQSRCHAALKAYVLDRIATAYPWLERECLRQKANLGG
jgi:hypothetical protein